MSLILPEALDSRDALRRRAEEYERKDIRSYALAVITKDGEAKADFDLSDMEPIDVVLLIRALAAAKGYLARVYDGHNKTLVLGDAPPGI